MNKGYSTSILFYIIASFHGCTLFLNVFWYIIREFNTNCMIKKIFFLSSNYPKVFWGDI